MHHARQPNAARLPHWALCRQVVKAAYSNTPVLFLHRWGDRVLPSHGQMVGPAFAILDRCHSDPLTTGGSLLLAA